MPHWRTLLAFSAVWLALAAPATIPATSEAEAKHATDANKGADATVHIGRKEVGEASFYSQKFAARRMADGHHFDPRANVAASKTLPIGTVATVTNLHTGKSATVKIEDRGPYVRGRVLDLSPKVARQIGISKKAGVAPVSVAPVALPKPAR